MRRKTSLHCYILDLSKCQGQLVFLKQVPKSRDVHLCEEVLFQQSNPKENCNTIDQVKLF